MRNFSLSLLGLMTVLGLSAAGRADDPPASHDHHAQAFDQCAKACGDCQRACDSCATHCQHMLAQGKKEHQTTLRTCLDCADHCAAAARITARQDPSRLLFARLAKKPALAVAKSARRFDDEHMKKCAEECRKCEKACREMLTHVAQGK